MTTKKKSTKQESVVVPSALKKALAGLPEGAGEMAPNLPVRELVMEATDVAKASKTNAAKLRPMLTDKSLITSLPVRIAYLQDCQAHWLRVRDESSTKASRALREKAIEHKAQCLKAARFFCRHDEDAVAMVERISEGDGLTDLVDDLHALGGFFATYADAMTKWKYKGGAAAAGKLATELSKALRETLSGERVDTRAAEALEARNRAAMLVSDATTELREVARFVINDPKELRPFRARYANELARRAYAKRRVSPVTSVADGEDDF